MNTTHYSPESNSASCYIKPLLFYRSIMTAVLVGMFLTLVNQWDAIFSGAALNWVSVCITFVVPFCVSFTSGLVTRREMETEFISQKACEQTDPCFKDLESLEAHLHLRRTLNNGTTNHRSYR